MTTVVRHTDLPARTWRMEPESVRDAFGRAMRRRGERSLAAIMTTFGTSPEQTGRLFRVSRQAVDLWLKDGVPASRLGEVTRVAQAALALRRVFRLERIPDIVRGLLPGLGDRSILATIASDGPRPVLELLDRLTSYVPAA